MSNPEDDEKVRAKMWKEWRKARRDAAEKQENGWVYYTPSIHFYGSWSKTIGLSHLSGVSILQGEVDEKTVYLLERKEEWPRPEGQEERQVIGLFPSLEEAKAAGDKIIDAWPPREWPSDD